MNGSEGEGNEPLYRGVFTGSLKNLALCPPRGTPLISTPKPYRKHKEHISEGLDDPSKQSSRFNMQTQRPHEGATVMKCPSSSEKTPAENWEFADHDRHIVPMMMGKDLGRYPSPVECRHSTWNADAPRSAAAQEHCVAPQRRPCTNDTTAPHCTSITASTLAPLSTARPWGYGGNAVF